MPTISAILGDPRSAVLRNALLVYTVGSDTLVTVHEVKDGAICPGRPLDPEDFKGIMAVGDVAPQVVHERVFATHRSCTAWWRPAGPATLMGEDMPRVPINLPPLLFVAAANDLAVMALVEDKRPKRLEEQLCYAPLPNIYQDGRVCLGTMRKPAHTDVEGWEAAFFDSAFNVTHYRTKFHQFKGTAKDLYVTLKTKPFDRRWLVKTPITINALISAVRDSAS